MKITRHGSRRYHFETTIAEGGDRTRISWDESENELETSNNFQSDPHQLAQYDYKVRLSIPEVAAIIQILGEYAVETAPNEFYDELSKKIKYIQKLSLCSLGLTSKEIIEINDEETEL